MTFHVSSTTILSRKRPKPRPSSDDNKAMSISKDMIDLYRADQRLAYYRDTNAPPPVIKAAKKSLENIRLKAFENGITERIYQKNLENLWLCSVAIDLEAHYVNGCANHQKWIRRHAGYSKPCRFFDDVHQCSPLCSKYQP